MMNQYKMNQYKEETSQIHAPADLIRRTKLAVQEEEQRILSMGSREAQADSAHSRINRIYRWMYPAAGAAVFFIMIAVAAVTFRNGNGLFRSMSSKDTSACEEAGAAEPADMGMQSGNSDMAAAEQTEGVQSNGRDSATESGGAAGEADMADDGVLRGINAAPTEEAIIDDETVDKADMADSGAMHKMKAAKAEEAITEEETVAETDKAGSPSLSVTEVEKAPSFYGKQGTEQILINGITFYTVKNWYGSMAAYAKIDGEQYVIVGGEEGAAADQEAFAREAYELLKETGYIVE